MNIKLLMPIMLIGVLATAGYVLFDESEDIDGAVVASGTCGTNLTWEYDDVTTTLTIRGSGTTMRDYTSSTVPWYNYRESISEVIFDTPNLTYISRYAFYECTNLALTSLPSGVTSINSYMFDGCTNLALTSLPSGVTTIGESAFRGCTNLALTSLPSGVTTIGESAFRGCTNLALTSLPSGVTSINTYAFYNCTNLALTSLPSGVTSINTYAFYNCTNLALTSLPSGVTSIGTNTFYKCTNLALTSLPSGVTSIGANTFYECSSIQTIDIPSSVTNLGDRVFYNCTGLKHIEYDAVNVTSTWTIGFPFVGCTAIESVTIGENVQSLPNYLFYENNAVTSWTTINWNAINCADLSYDNMVFHNDKIHTIIFGDNVQHVPAYLTREFADTLESVSFNDGLESIGDSAFANATNMVALSLPDSVQSIGTWAFMGCSELRLYSLPSNLATVGSNAFSGCTQITDLTIYQVTKFNGDSGLRLRTVVLKASDRASAYENPEGNPWTVSQDTIQTVTLDGITHLQSNTFAGMNNIYEVLAVDVPNQLGWYVAPNAQSSVLANLVEGDEAWLMTYSSAEADINYDSPVVNLDNADGTIVVNGVDVPLEPDMMVYPTTYSESGDNMLGAMIKFIPIVVILSVLGALVMMVRGKRFEL